MTTVRRVGAQASDQGTILLVGVDLGGGVKTVGTPRLMSQGTLSPTGQTISTSRSAAKASSRSRCPTAPTPIPATALVHDGRRAASSRRQSVQPTITIPQNPRRSPSTRRASSRCDAAGFDHADHRRPDRPDLLHQQGRPAARSATICSRQPRPPARRRMASPTPTVSATCSPISNRPTSKWSRNLDLIAAQRAYEMNAKVVSAADQMLQSTQHVPLEDALMIARSLLLATGQAPRGLRFRLASA